MKKVLIFILCLNMVLLQKSRAQNVGIGTAAPNSSAILDVQSSNKGMLVPRIALTGANVASPVTAPADALLIYNTATAGAGVDAVVPGFYYWKSAVNRWSAISQNLSAESVGYGTWGGCGNNNIAEYYPVVDTAGATGDQFGYTVSISGNYAIVGSPADDTEDGINCGSASIYQFNGTNWQLMQKITDATGAAFDEFGKTVSISGNYAVVGANFDDGAFGADQGSASIYQYNGSNWVLMQKITDATGAASDEFGYTVSISGNYAIVGSPADDGAAGTNQGSVSIYQYNGTDWVLMQKITDAAGAASDNFGFAVSISGSSAIVGAPFNGPFSAKQGSASIYQYNGSNWVMVQKIVDPAGLVADQFGFNVSISSSYAVVGANRDDGTAGIDQGNACIYQYNGSNWVMMQKITDATGAAGDQFGHDVCISGNYLIVGAILLDDVAGTDQGAASIYIRLGTGWQKVQFVTDPGGNASDRFGIGTAIEGSTRRFLIGAFGHGITGGKAVFGRIN